MVRPAVVDGPVDAVEADRAQLNSDNLEKLPAEPDPASQRSAAGLPIERPAGSGAGVSAESGVQTSDIS